jgi:trehalose-6-phosphate synthase
VAVRAPTKSDIEDIFQTLENGKQVIEEKGKISKSKYFPKMIFSAEAFVARYQKYKTETTFISAARSSQPFIW